MENKDLAAAWLEICPNAQGAVYFDNCVVYIDEAHTRGTDLKLPVDAKGAVTLGLGQTKGQTVQ
ncbi:hypothetical protein ACHAO7_011334, partial [Fusarium culmorum]